MWDFVVSPPGYVAFNRKLSPIPQFRTLLTTILAKQFLSIVPDFQEMLHCVQNWSQKRVSWDFDISPPGHVAINRKLSPNPQIYKLETTILAENN